MSSRDAIKSVGDRVIPKDQIGRFNQLLEMPDLSRAAQMAERWIPDAERCARIKPNEVEALRKALDNAQAIAPPVAPSSVNAA